jgi:Spy/CpxP family protein refolding chaperone
MKRTLVAALIMLALTIAVDAQQRRGGPPPGGGMGMGQPPDPAAALKAALNLTEAQVVSVQALLQTRQQRAQGIQTEIEQKRLGFEAALNAPSPDPATVGNAAIALRASENKMAAERDWFLAELKKLLTADQQATLDNLIKAGTPIPGLFGGMRGRGGPRG